MDKSGGKRWLPLVTVVAVLLAGSAGGSLRAEELLRIGTYHHYPPLTISAGDGTIRGFEIDMIDDLCRRLDATCQVNAVDWEQVFDDLEHGRYDAYIGGMGVTEERARKVAFTQPYARTPAFFATTVGHPLTSLVTLYRLDLDHLSDEDRGALGGLIEGLRGQRVGVHVGTVYEDFAQRYLAEVAELRRYRSELEKYADLAQGRLDAILDNGCQLIELIRSGSNQRYQMTLFGPGMSGGPFSRGSAIAVRRGNTALQARFEGALAAAKADGTLARLSLIWFGYNVIAE